MTTEQSVIGGRETFGEPKSWPTSPWTSASLDTGEYRHRHGQPHGGGIIELGGTLGDELAPPPADERLDYLKFLRNPSGEGFDDDPWLVDGTWAEPETRSARAVDAALTLRESLRSGG